MVNYQDIYETMIGMRSPGYMVPGVENAFDEGTVCSRAYEQMRDAYARVCDRLGLQEWEDPDLDIMVSAMERMQKDLCQRMLAYGMEAAGK